MWLHITSDLAPS